MNKAERQERHRQRLERKEERDRINVIYQKYWYEFEAAAMRQVRDMPVSLFTYPCSVSLLYMPSLRNPVHRRLEWNDDSVLLYQKTWLFDDDYHHFVDAPQGPEDPRSPEEYWRDVKPTIEEKQETLPRKSASELRALIADLRLPIQTTIPSYLCCDGESYELTFAHGEAISTWKWHNEAPEPWKELEKIVVAVQNIVPFVNSDG